MERSAASSPHSTAAHHWWELPSRQEVLLIGIKYWRIFLGLLVASMFLYAEERLREMDSQFFQPSLQGVLGLTHYQLGRYSQAAQAYRADLRNGGWRKWATGDKAYSALLQGNLREAIRLAETRILENEDDIEAWLTLGEATLEEGNVRRAAGAFDHVVALKDTHYDALLLSAIAHTQSGDITKATDRLRLALRNNSTGYRITTFLSVLQTAGDLRQDSSHTARWCLLAHYYRYLRIFDPSNSKWAREAATRAINAGDRIDDAYITLGILEDKVGNYDAALPYFLKAVEANPQNAEAYRWAANAYRHRGSDLLNEYEMWKGAYRASSSNGFYRNGLVAFLTERFGDYPQALELVQQALQSEPDNTELILTAANIYQRLGNHEVAIRAYREILKLKPRSPHIYDAIGYSLIFLGRYDDAIASFQAALVIDPGRFVSHKGLGAVYSRQGRNADVIREYETAVKMGDDDVDSRAFLCNQYWAANRYEEAEACLKYVLTREPHHKSAMQLYPYIAKALEHSHHER
jgi:tetratricopeptide (TPR) repeat protein